MELGRLESPTLLGGLLPSAAPAPPREWCYVVLAALASGLAATAVRFLLLKLRVSAFRRGRTLVRLPSFCSFDDDASACSDDSEAEDGEESDGMEERNREEEEEEGESGDFGSAKTNGMANFSFPSFSLADLVGGMGVVKAWDGLGLAGSDLAGVDMLGSFNSVASKAAGVDFASPAEIVSAANEAGGAVVRVWDVRARGETPAGTARPLLRRRVAGVRALERKVFVRGDGGEIAALDLRSFAQL